MSRSKQLAQRRKELVVRSTVLRAHMLADGYLMRFAATPSRIGSDLLSTLRENKLLIAGAVLAVIVVKPRRIISGHPTGRRIIFRPLPSWHRPPFVQ